MSRLMRTNEGTRSRETLGLATLFGVMYFVQGVSEPTEGLIAQPVRSLLKDWGRSPGEITAFMALLAIPWSLKPLYGILTDFVPLGGTRRRGWLLLMTAATVVSLATLFFWPVPRGATSTLLVWLLVPTVAVAFSDVVVDALMVEKGQPLGITGRLQSVQWAAIYGATILTGVLGGYLSQHKLQQAGFLIAAGVTLVSLILAVVFVKEGRRGPQAAPPRRGTAVLEALRALWQTARSPAVLLAGGFLFLWNFNPFSTTMLQLHMTGFLGYSEQFYGNTASVLAVGAMLGSIAYGFYCRRVPFSKLLHVSIVMGVGATLVYIRLERDNALLVYIVSFVAGFTWMTGSLVQLDLAARTCPPATAGTTFALLMALSNLATSSSQLLGGQLYDLAGNRWGRGFAFTLLVCAGAACTATCWLLVPFLKRHAASSQQ